MSKLALKLIAENKKTRATSLDLGLCGLTEVPDEIGDLVWLEELSFASEWWNDGWRSQSLNTGKVNNITLLGNGFYQLNKLRGLWLNGGRYRGKFDLADLSPLANLDSLEKLSVYNTQVENLSSLADLSNLQELDVGCTLASDLTPLSNLSCLRWLYVSSTEVSDLKPLKGLINLKKLYIQNTKITDLIPLINISELQHINVAETKITDLSPLLSLIEKGLEVNLNPKPKKQKKLYNTM